MRVQPAPVEHYPWITARASCIPSASFQAIEAVDEVGRIWGMVGYDCWTPNSVQMHVALACPSACRPLLRPAFWCAFKQAPVEIILGTIRGDNAPSLNFAARLGFRTTHRTVDGWEKGVDLVHVELRRSECRFLQPRRRVN